MNRLTLVVAVILTLGAGPAHAWDTRHNPDVMPSIGWGLHGGSLAGIPSDNAKFTEFGADFRLPVTNYLSLTVDFAQTTVSNAPLGVSTDSNRYGASMRVYLGDFLK